MISDGDIGALELISVGEQLEAEERGRAGSPSLAADSELADTPDPLAALPTDPFEPIPPILLQHTPSPEKVPLRMTHLAVERDEGDARLQGMGDSLQSEESPPKAMGNKKM